MSTIDAIYSKMDQIPNGMSPSIMQKFTATNRYGSANSKATVIIAYKLPADTLLDSQVICTVAGAQIRRSTTAYPESETDGDLVATVHPVYPLSSPLEGTYTDSNVELGVTYYYAAFPYSDQGVFTRNQQSRAEVTTKKYAFYYGYDKAEPGPSTTSCITYPSDVQNASFSPFAMNLSTGVPDYGGWLNSPLFDMFRPVMLKSNGTVDYELSHTNHNYKIDGVTASDVANSSYDGNAMVEMKRMYYYRWTDADGNTSHFRVSDQPIETTWVDDPFWDENGVEKEARYLPMFEGSLISSKCRSLSGKTPYNNAAGATEITACKANGSGWNLDDISGAQLIMDLMFMIGKSTDVQTAFGAGHNSGGTSASNLLATGGTLTAGMFYGTSGNTYMKAFYIENFYGDRWDRKHGMITNSSSQILVKMKPPYDDTGAGSGYTNTGLVMSGTSGGYISKTHYDLNGRIPTVVSGSSTTYIPDGAWFAASCFLLFGGCCAAGFLVGFAFYLGNALSIAAWTFGPSPSYV